jgi:hypothetical protein
VFASNEDSTCFVDFGALLSMIEGRGEGVVPFVVAEGVVTMGVVTNGVIAGWVVTTCVVTRGVVTREVGVGVGVIVGVPRVGVD